MFIRVDYTPEVDEFARGILVAFRRRHRAFQALGVAAIPVLAASYELRSANHASSPASWWSIAVPLALVGLYLILTPWLHGMRMKRQYRQQKVRKAEVSFTDDGVTWQLQTEGGEHRSVVGWARYVKIRETSEFFLLFPSRKRVISIPKRAFSPDQARLFSRFIEYGFEQARTTQPEVALTAQALD